MSQLLAVTLVIVVATLPRLGHADALTEIIQQDLTTLGYATGGTDGEMNVETAVAISQFQAERGMDVTGEVTPQLAGVLKAAINKPDMPAPVVQEAPATPAAQAAQAQPAQPQQGSAIGAIAGAMAPSMAQGMLQGATGIDPAMLQAVMGGEPSQQSAQMDPETMQALQAQMTQTMGGAMGMDQAGIEAMQAMQMEAMQEQAQQACLQQKIAEAQAAQESAQKRRGFGSLMRAVSRLGGDEIAGSIASASADIAEANATITDLQSAASDLGLTDEDVASCGTAQ
jgi:hypothetical protein